MEFVWSSIMCAILVVFASGSPTEKDYGLCGNETGTGNATILYYYNTVKDVCLAYRSEGCHKTGSPESFDACGIEKQRIFENVTANQVLGLPCAGFALPLYQTPEVKQILQNSSACQDDCPDGYDCKEAENYKSCCNQKIEAQYDDAYGISCPNGKDAFFNSVDDVTKPFVGDSCKDLPCPHGYGCVQVNDLFAMCCATGD